jgi:Flp pilus assembly pilin Flp
MPLLQSFDVAKAKLRKEQGQVMAEYGVVLAVLTLGIVLTLVALAGGINSALGGVIGHL